MPHSEFLDWDPVDRAKALAFTLEKNSRCVMCGTAPWEWDPKLGGNRRAYEAVEVFCPGCYAKAGMRHGTEGRNMDGITIELAHNDGSVETAQRHVRARKLSREG